MPVFPKLRQLFLIVFLSTVYCLLSTGSAQGAEPFPPFSVEGNPPEKYYFEEIFPLFTYIRPSYFQVFENENYSREYQNLHPCYDRRDQYCNSEGDGCDGGEIDVCYNNPLRFNEVHHTAHSNNGSCKLAGFDEENPDALIEGKCEYKRTARIDHDIMGTDFSANDSKYSESTSPDPDSVTSSDFTGLTYPKLQNEAYRYGYIGDSNNPITYGSHFLALNQCERGVRQLLVVARAKQTKATLRQTGEWPLGWVDWGYTTPNGTTLINIYNSLPGGIAGASKIIMEGIDDYYLNSGGYEQMSDISKMKKKFCTDFSTAIANEKKWATDLSQAPIYSPSFRQGYVRASICVWRSCCPGPNCPLNLNPLYKLELIGKSKSLYYDTSISQAFGAALDDLLLYYPLEEAAKIFNRAVVNNYLIRFLTSASVQATPSVIQERLNAELEGNECFDSRPNPFRWLNFGVIFDYLNESQPSDTEDKCSWYKLQPELPKERGGAFNDPSLLKRIIDLFWKKSFDDVSPVKKHLVTVPDAMGQSISELQGHIYNTRDTLTELEKMEEYNKNMSNTVDDSANGLFAGKHFPIAQAKRHLSLYPCSSGEYATYETSIEAYALGARPSCLKIDSSNSENLCDPTAFEELISDSPWDAPLPEAVQTILNSKMFVNGKLNPELEEVYAQAAKETGLPCEVLAGLHFEEGSMYFTDNVAPGPTKVSITSGNKLEPGQSLLDNALIAGSAFMSRHPPSNTSTLITSISNFNGGGNSNCQLGYPYDIPYTNCPKQYDGEDDPYATNMLDPQHTNMWLLFHYDNTAGEPTPYGTDRPGAFSVALTVYNEATSKNSIPTDNDPNNQDTSTPPNNGIPTSKPKKCGPNSLDTALGCLSYGDDLASTLLTFLIGISGVIALAVMLAGTIQIMTAAGDIEKSRKSKELFTAAIVGLFFIIFSVTLLRTFAGEIIRLPGF